MSARLLRRVLKEQEEQRPGPADLDPEPDGGDDEESDSPTPSRNPFDLLDQQEDEQEVTDVDNVGAVIVEEYPVVKNSSDVHQASNRKSKKKKKKNKVVSTSRKHQGEKSLDLILEDLSINENPSTHQLGFESVKSSSSEIQATTKKQGTSSILVVDPNYLKAENELRKIFGSKVVSSFENKQTAGSSRNMYGGRRAVHNPRKTVLVTPLSYWPRWDGSMSMELLETKDGLHYFRYEHSPSYSHTQEAFEAAKAINDLNAIGSILAHHPYHIESLLTFAEVFKFSGEHQSSADLIAKCLYALECAWHPLFTPFQGNCRLKYSHDTNKPLFSTLFSHMKHLDRRGCHRSALEVCKLLLSLDPDDPKGALFCIDYFSLRAHEHKWLEQFSEEYRSDNSMWLFPNFSYSLAVCRFYLERDAAASAETSVQTEKATSTDLMQQALLLHPLVLQKLVAKAPLKDSAWTQILKSSVFGSVKAGGPTLEHLIDIYVERNYLIWRFPELQNLLKESALRVIEALKQNSSEARDWTCVRKEAFSSEKNEYSHLLVSDFSDTTPSIPPEELRQFMVGPQIVHEVHDGNGGAVPERARAPREVVGRNAALVFLESLLPWMDYGDGRSGHPDGLDQDND